MSVPHGIRWTGRSSISAGNGLGGRAQRIAASVLLIAAVLGVAHVSARPTLATDCVTYYCATLTLSITGNGYGHAVDDQGGLDCYYNAGSTYGTCSYQYYWIGESSPTLAVSITLTANANSYACTISCSDPGGSKAVLEYLQRNQGVTLDAQFNLAKTLTVHITTSGDGAGTTTSSPSGINCQYADGVASGTCAKTWYFVTSISITLSAVPTTGNQACEWDAGHWFCGAINETYSWNNGTSFTGVDLSDPVKFQKGHPIVTVGVQGAGSVASSPSGISCPSTCSSYFPPNSNVTLTAAAKSGYVFRSWSGACSGFGSVCNLSLGTTDVATTAVFGTPATPAPTPKPTGVTGPPRPSGPTPTPTSSSTTPPTAQPGASEPPMPGAATPPSTGASNRPAASTSPLPGPSGIGTVSTPGATPPAADPLAIVLAVAVGIGLGIGGLGLYLLGRSRGRASTPRS